MLANKAQWIYFLPDDTAMCFYGGAVRQISAGLGRLLLKIPPYIAVEEIERFANEPAGIEEAGLGGTFRSIVSKASKVLMRSALKDLLKEARTNEILVEVNEQADSSSQCTPLVVLPAACGARGNADMLASAGSFVFWSSTKTLNGDVAQEFFENSLSTTFSRVDGLSISPDWDAAERWKRLRFDSRVAAVQFDHSLPSSDSPILSDLNFPVMENCCLDNRSLPPPFFPGEEHSAVVFSTALSKMEPHGISLRFRRSAAARTEPPCHPEDSFLAETLIGYLLDIWQLPQGVRDGAERLQLMALFLEGYGTVEDRVLRDILWLAVARRSSGASATPDGSSVQAIPESVIARVRSSLREYAQLLRDWPTAWNSARAERLA